MRILNLGLDSSVLNKNSRLARRIIEYGNLVEKYIIIVSSNKHESTVLSGNAQAYGVSGRNKLSKLLGIYRLAQKIIEDEKIDIITVQDQYYLGLIAWLLARKNNIGLELQIHGFEKYGGLRKIIAKLIIPKADIVRTVSQRLKKRLVEEFGVKAERITVVPIYVVVSDKRLEVRDKRNNQFVFLTVGRLVPVKNIGLQIMAMAEVVKKYPNTELWIVGEGSEKKKLEDNVKRLDLEGQVKFFGWQDDVSNFYNQAGVFLLTSDAEGWPLVIIEAAGFGLPIIMTDTGSAGEFIINGENGIVIGLNDQQALEQAMIKLMESRDLRKRLGDGAREAFSQLPSKEKILELYKESWKKAMHNANDAN
jgi:glycosyltransferase involved in cell wall biosynthesis